MPCFLFYMLRTMMLKNNYTRNSFFIYVLTGSINFYLSHCLYHFLTTHNFNETFWFVATFSEYIDFKILETLSCSSFYLSLKREVNGLKAKLKVSQLQVGNTALRSTRYLQPKRGEEIKKKNIFILKMLL